MLPERTDRIGGSNDSAASLQWCDDSSFRNGDALLLHGFMDAGPVLIVHLNYEEKKQVHLSIQLKIALNWSKKIGESASKTSLKLQTGPNFNIHSPYQTRQWGRLLGLPAPKLPPPASTLDSRDDVARKPSDPRRKRPDL